MAKNKYYQTTRGKIRQIFTEKVHREAAAARRDTIAMVKEKVANHEVSKELRSHKDSSFFKQPRGSLFGFMGFEAGTDPVGRLLVYLGGSFQLNKRRTRGFFGMGRKIVVEVNAPTNENMMRAGLVVDGDWAPWTSWPNLLEDGVPGLEAFFSAKGYGRRSQEGWQADFLINKDERLMQPVEYLTPIFTEARDFFYKNLFQRLKS